MKAAREHPDRQHHADPPARAGKLAAPLAPHELPLQGAKPVREIVEGELR